MKYLCLIYLDEARMAQLTESETSRLNERHLALNVELLASGQFIEAEALQPAAATASIRVRNGHAALTDGLLALRLGYVFAQYTTERESVPPRPWLLAQGGRLARPLLFRRPH